MRAGRPRSQEGAYLEPLLRLETRADG
jgi:hypothetical protein